MDLTKLLESPAVVTHRGVMFHSRGGSQLAPTAEAFAIDTDAYGPIDQRALDRAVALTLTPLGVWTEPHLAVLYRWANARPGQLVTPRYDIASVDTTEDTLTLLDVTGPRKGCPVRLGSWGTLPAPLVAGTLYYIGVPDDESPEVVTLHATEAHALAGTNLIDLTDTGTGDHAMIEQEPLIIHTYDNRRITFHNAAVVTMPPIIHTATATLLGQVGFAAFPINNSAWSDANSLYTVDKALLTDIPPDPADIPTQEYAAAWGASPWDAFKLRGALTITPNLATTPITTDARGGLSLKIGSVSAAATGAPEQATEAQLLDVLDMQGGTAARGKSKRRADLVVTGTGVHNTLYNAAATALPQTFSPTDPRAGEISWVAARSPAGPAFRVSTTAPES